MKISILTLTLLFTFLAGCATIVGQPTQTLPISSTPDRASVVITDEKGHEVFKGVTPTTVTLEKSDGSYWGGKSFKVVISKEGYEVIEIPIKTSPNGWYLAGNLLFGGLIGWFIVDPLNGDMYTLSTKEVNAELLSIKPQNSLKNHDEVSIILLDNVPDNLRPKLTKLN